MARITPYQQQRLESSVVGVPQMPEAGQILAANEIANTGRLMDTGLQAQSQNVSGQIGAMQTLASGLGNATNHAAAGLEQAMSQKAYEMQQTRNALIAAQKEQAAREKQQQTHIDALNANNHSNMWEQEANQLATSYSMGKAPDGTPVRWDKIPSALQTALYASQTKYATNHDMSDGEFQSFMERTNNHITTLHGEALKQYKSVGTLQALNNQKVADDTLAKSATSPDDLMRLSKSLADPANMTQRYNAYGANLEIANKVLMHKAQLNVANTMAADAKLVMAKDPQTGEVKQTNTVEDARKQGLFSELSETEWHSVSRYAEHTINGQLANITKKMVAASGKNIMSVTDVLGNIELSKNTDGYGKALADGRKQLGDMLAHQMNLHMYEDDQKTPRFDGNGNAIEYRDPKFYEHIMAGMEKIDGLSHAYDNDAKRIYKEQLKQLGSEIKQDVTQQTQTIKGAQDELSRSKQDERASSANALFTSAITHLHNLRVPDTEGVAPHAPNGKVQPYQTGDDETQAYVHAVSAFAHMVQGGYLDSKIADKHRQYLNLVGDRLVHGSPSDNDKALLEQNLRKLTMAAPKGLAYVMQHYGVSKSDTDRELLSRTIDYYHKAKQLVPGVEPDGAIIDTFRKAAETDMKAAHAQRASRLVPPPPPVMLMLNQVQMPSMPVTHAESAAPQFQPQTQQEETPQLPSVDDIRRDF